MLNKPLLAGALALSALTGGAAAAATYDLGFIMDRSNSISEANYTAAMNSLATALNAALTPTLGSGDIYTVSVVTFNDSAQDVVTQTINNAGDLATVVAAVTAAGAQNTSGATNYRAAFDELRNNFGSLGDYSLVNMMTDGEPNVPSDPFNAARQGRLDLFNAGWDSLSFEAVGGGLSGSDIAFLRELAFDTDDTAGTLGTLEAYYTDEASITDPLNDAFVLRVDNFGADYDRAIKAKIQKIVDPDPVPVPAALPLMAGALGLMGFVGFRKRRT